MSTAFSTEQIELLKTMLEKELADVRVEIHHTDKYEFKQQLKERERELLTIMEMLEKK